MLPENKKRDVQASRKVKLYLYLESSWLMKTNYKII